jgi:hypothetical protein
MSSCNCNDCIICERKQRKDWISTHPFPTYSDMCDRIRQKFPEKYIELIAEYGEYNHTSLKIIYDSNIDKIISIKIGKSINSKGGMEAMVANNIIFKYCTPLSDAPYITLSAQPRILQSYWSGIGEFVD